MAVGHKKSNYNTEAILKEIYPKVEQSLTKRLAQWKQCISKFVHDRSESLFDTMPVDRIYYHDSDRELLFNALGLDMKEINKSMKNTYYADVKKFNPQAAKDPTTIVALCIVRYFLLKKDPKNLDLAIIYLSFSGKFYPSIHSGSFTFAPTKYRHIMEYVVNTRLTNKYELKRSGHVMGAIKSIATLWADSYRKEFIDFDDEDVTYVIQQLHNRIKSFMKNIANMYYEAYKNKDFITYDKDSLPEEGDGSVYHLATNDSLKLNSYVENTMTLINTTRVDVKVCKDASDGNVSAEEIRNIMEAIFGDKEQLPRVKEFIELVIASFLASSTVKDVNSVQFVQFCIKPKPNTKDPTVLRAKDLIDEFLDDVSIAYRKRKHRNATKQSYHRAFNYYLCAIIIKANR